jgi:hypothetical protein
MFYHIRHESFVGFFVRNNIRAKVPYKKRGVVRDIRGVNVAVFAGVGVNVTVKAKGNVFVTVIMPAERACGDAPAGTVAAHTASVHTHTAAYSIAPAYTYPVIFNVKPSAAFIIAL